MTSSHHHHLILLLLTKITLFLCLLFVTASTQRIPHIISNDTFQNLFHLTLDDFQTMLVTPSSSTSNLKATDPYEAFFILFYDPVYDESLQVRQLFHKFYAEYETHLTELFRKRGVKDFQDFQAHFDKALQIAEVDCSESSDICETLNIKTFPTIIYLSGGKLDSDIKTVQRQTYQYTSRVSVHDLLYFCIKVYSHRVVDLSMVRPIQIDSSLLKKVIAYLHGETLMYIVCFLVMPFVFGYFMAQGKNPNNQPEQQNIKRTNEIKIDKVPQKNQ